MFVVLYINESYKLLINPTVRYTIRYTTVEKLMVTKKLREDQKVNQAITGGDVLKLVRIKSPKKKITFLVRRIMLPLI
jgi:hypothetical protein